MRLTVALILLSLVHVSASVYSQNKKLNLNLKNASLQQVFKAIQEQSEFDFFYRNEQIPSSANVSVQSDNEPVEAILDNVLKGTGLNYYILDKDIVISSKEIGLSNSSQQQKKITGKVTDSSGASLPGAAVVVKGTTTGATTEADGTFKLLIPSDAKLLVFSFVGMKTQEVAITSKSEYNIVLTEETVGIEEVVAIGYGTVKKSDLTGSVSSVKSETLKNLPVKSLSEALQGKVAGVYVTKGSGEPGAGSDIIIRGAASINGLGPLYIVDGVRMGTGNNFNMSDVENIEILKDASSAAIYGVEAAGGVILVTTKKGKAGEKMHVDFNAYYGTRSAVNLPTLLGSKDYIKARKIMGVEYASWNNSTANTDWMSEMYSPAVEQKYDLSLSGGNEKSTYYISAGYLKEEGIRRNNWFERFSLRMNSDHKLTDNLTIGQYLYINKTKNRPTGDGSDLPYRSIPLMQVYDPTRVGGWAGVPDGFQGTNWVGAAESRIYNNNSWGMEGNFFADWKIIKGLNLRATVGGYMGGDDNSQFNLLYDYGILKNDIRKLEKGMSRNESMNGNAVLTYSRSFGKHDIKAMAGWEAIKSTGTNINASAEGFPVYYMPSFTTSTQSSTARFADAGYGKGSQLAQFGRLNYNFAGKYLLQGTVRRDGTNKFIGANKYGVFPSVSGAWKVSEESFLKDNTSLISNLKIRAGWGVLGSIGSVGDFIYQSAYKKINVHSFDGINAVTGWGDAKFANTDIRWEKVTTKNIGVDLGFLKNRLTFALEFYDKQTSDMIYTVALPVSSGIGEHNGEYGGTINIGKISNRGFEFEANWNDKIGELSYSVGANASFNKNKVVQIGEKGSLIYEGGATWMNSSISRTEDGYAMGQYYGYIADGIFKTDAQAAQSAQKDAKSGDLIYRDLNGKDANGKLTAKPDGKIDDADKTYIGNPWPKCFYGINFDLAYKGFDLKAFFQGQAGVDLFNSTKGIRQSFYADYNTTSEIFNTSKFGNTNITGLPSVYQTSGTGEILRDPNGNYKNVSSFFVENGSYIKLKDLQLGYTLPEYVSKKIGLNSTRIFIEGSNLLTITKYTGLDPEVGGGVKGRGIETNGLYPQTRFISMGVNLKF
ncbi:MAG: TonB-dependent receptor [Mariniphaga sp.]|nr:TonB-dependent receptor [Mariniphaga sp.]